MRTRDAAVRTIKINMSSQADCASLLLVDDDAIFRQVLARALEKRGFAVSCAEDVETASAMAVANPPEYAVIDLKMPGPSGLVLMQRLKALDAETRIVMLTGYASFGPRWKRTTRRYALSRQTS